MTEITLLWSDVSDVSEEDIKKALTLVSGKRAEKAMKMRMTADRKLSLGAELLLRKAVKKDKISFWYGEKEKPYIEGGPFFNISHSGDIVICAVADREIGCDIEKIKDYNEKIAKRFFAEEEYRWINNQTDRKEAFFRIWTLKEAFIKATGRGLSLPLNEFSVRIGERITACGYGGEFSFGEPFIHSQYRCSVCLEGDTGLPIKVENVPFAVLLGGNHDL